MMIITTGHKIMDSDAEVFTLDYGVSSDVDPEKRDQIKKKIEETLVEVSHILQGQ